VPHRCKAASGRPLLFLNPWSDCEWGENCKRACRGIRRQVSEYWTCRIPISGLREPITVPGGMVSTAAIGKTAGSETKMPRRPAQLTQADIARVISAAKQAGASEAYTNNWNAVPLI
jgi:hypothetical protein